MTLLHSMYIRMYIVICFQVVAVYIHAMSHVRTYCTVQNLKKVMKITFTV